MRAFTVFLSQIGLLLPLSCFAAPPAPVLSHVFPAGARQGTTVEVEVGGSQLQGGPQLRCTIPDIKVQLLENTKNRFRLEVPDGTPPGQYDIRVSTAQGLSGPRPFCIGTRQETLEQEPNDSPAAPQAVPLDATINGRIEKAGDQDVYQFTAGKGQRVVIECRAHRIDSRLRAILEVQDERGRRLAANQGYFGTDPLIDLVIPQDGKYFVKLHDLVYSGSADHYYRLDVDTGPRVAFAVPSVIQRGKTTRVRLFGWNLGSNDKDRLERRESQFESIEVTIPAEQAHSQWPLPVRLESAQIIFRGLAYHLASSHAPILIGVSDQPVTEDGEDNHGPSSARLVSCPCEVSGRLSASGEQDWFAIDVRRGEVLYFEGLAQRIGAPVDLDLRVLDPQGQKELVRFQDQVSNDTGNAFPSHHLDPSGRWVAPTDGRYLLLVRDLTAGRRADPRRFYRVRIRREEPDFDLALVPRAGQTGGLNVQPGGRTLWEVVAFRRRGLSGSIRVQADQLPTGVTCDDVWLGPGIQRAPLVVSADRQAVSFAGGFLLNGSTPTAGDRPVRGGVTVRTGQPTGWARLTDELPLAVTRDKAPLKITADGHQPRDHHLYGKLRVRHSPGGVLDVAVHVEREDSGHQAEVQLIGVGVPGLIANQTATIPAGRDKGFISFYLPPSLPIGRYSLAVRGETTVPKGKASEKVTAISNVVNFEVHPAAFRLEVDPYAPRKIKRGEVIQVKYTARRTNGFISKIHTELATPGVVTEVPGLRGRGVTFVGQTDAGVIQIIANQDAPLGQQPFLRLYGVGVLEDEARFHGSCWLRLEVVE